MSQSAPRRALVSVSNKQDLDRFAARLVELGFEIVSTGGTRRFLEQRGIAAVDLSGYTDFPEIMNGRVKTLHPKIHGAILGRPNLPADVASMTEHGIVPFELVVCNLYPFEETIEQADVTAAEAIEQIDIGGPSMIRAAAKNHISVGVITSPSQYDDVLAALSSTAFDETFRRRLAAEAFEMTARYDRAIADYMASLAAVDVTANQAADEDVFSATLSLCFQKKSILRYGENPHQRAAFYTELDADGTTLAAARQLHGKELSYNNLLDLDAALEIVRDFDVPAAVVIKHNNPCGCGMGSTLAEAVQKAYAGDPLSAFGSVLGFNRPVDLATAEQLCEPNRFIEAMIAPGYEADAFHALTTRPKWKNNVRLMGCADLRGDRPSSWDYRRISGGLLVQDRDETPDPTAEWPCVTDRQPTEAERDDLKFAWLVARHVRSNAIVFVRGEAIVGVGAGQMSRLDSAFIAAHKAGERSRGSVMASDAFFPFRDGIDEAAKVGITAVIQPGGSRRDKEVITACNEQNLAMLCTGRRHFRH